MTGPVVIAAGGTGGHLFPAVAVAEELLSRGREVVAVTDRRGGDLASRLGGAPTHRLRASPIGGRSLGGKIVGAVDLLRGALEARRLLRRLGASVVAGFGGYPTVPPLLAAHRLGAPSLIHEQNAVLGRANRLLARRVDLVATSFERTEGLDAGSSLVCGNPVRAAIAALAGEVYAAPDPGEPFRLLVFGGSQGARVLGRVAPEALRRLSAGLRARLAVTQQCRPEDVEAVRAAYGGLGVEAEVEVFFDDMAARLANAHLAVCRAGASTVAELAAAGRPAILIPYPHAADDHQSANARSVEAAGGGWLMPEAGLTAQALAARIESLAGEPATLAGAAAAARGTARPGAARALADAIERLAGRDGGRDEKEQAA